MDDSLASLAVALAAARESDLLAGLQLSEAQRSLGLSPQLVFLAGVALALPAQVDGGGATFTAGQERTFARLQIAYGQACRRASDGAPPHPTRLYKLSPLLIPAQPLSIAELLRVSTPSAGPTASSEAGVSPAAPAPDAPAPDAPDAALAAACAAAAAAAAQLLAEESAEERRPGTAPSVPTPRAKPKGRARPPGPPRAQGSSRGGSQVDQPRRGSNPHPNPHPHPHPHPNPDPNPDPNPNPKPNQEPGGEGRGGAEAARASDRERVESDRSLAELAAPPLREIDAEAFDAAEWTEVSESVSQSPYP